MQLDTFPANIHEITTTVSVDILKHRPGGDASTAFDVAHDVRPEGPGALVPGGGGADIDGGAGERGKGGLERRGKSEGVEVRVAD